VDATGRANRDDPSPRPRARLARVGVAAHRFSRPRRSGARGPRRLARPLGGATPAAVATAGDCGGAGPVVPRIRRPPRGHELAARPRPSSHRPFGPARRSPEHVDPRLGWRDRVDGAFPRLPGSRVPPASRRARLLREPSPARGSHSAPPRCWPAFCSPASAPSFSCAA
jgi:hypothetical protein